jgi:GNAT superfamily N-acetyltransferase
MTGAAFCCNLQNELNAFIFETDKKMNQQIHSIRNAMPAEFPQIGAFMVEVYSQLQGFPKKTDQPEYYDMLFHIGALTEKPATELFVAVSFDEQIRGAVVYYGDMKYYGSGGTATMELKTAGFRFLAVNPLSRRQGIGKLLVEKCIHKARLTGKIQMIIHSTMAMQAAWKMYQDMGFKRSEDLDFMQGELPVFGFRLIF